MIEVRNLTMKYSSGKGIFDLDFAVKEGEVMADKDIWNMDWLIQGVIGSTK
jgi:hypothetical protein